jgi:hypothetical protein
MSITIHQRHGISNVLEVEVAGKFSRGDYDSLGSAISRLVRDFGKIQILVDLTSFAGWDLRSFWKNISFAQQHFSGASRIALVGCRPSERILSLACRMLTDASLRYFDCAHKDQARTWIDSPSKETLLHAISTLPG